MEIEAALSEGAEDTPVSKLRSPANSSVNKRLAELRFGVGGRWENGDTKQTNREINKIPKEIIQRVWQ